MFTNKQGVKETALTADNQGSYNTISSLHIIMTTHLNSLTKPRWLQYKNENNNRNIKHYLNL